MPRGQVDVASTSTRPFRTAPEIDRAPEIDHERAATAETPLSTQRRPYLLPAGGNRGKNAGGTSAGVENAEDTVDVIGGGPAKSRVEAGVVLAGREREEELGLDLPIFFAGERKGVVRKRGQPPFDAMKSRFFVLENAAVRYCISIYLYVYIYVCMYVCMYIHMYVYMYIQMCANAAAYQAGRDTSVSKYTDIDTDTYVCAYRQTHTTGTMRTRRRTRRGRRRRAGSAAAACP